MEGKQELDNIFCSWHVHFKWVSLYTFLTYTFSIFKVIYLHCLPPGHTHEDIDQSFSSWSTHYWKKGFGSPADVPSFLHDAYHDSTRPEWEMVHAVYDFKNVLRPCTTYITGYSKARAFKFVKHEQNVAMFHKESSLDVQWRGLPSDNSRGILLFQDIPPVDISFNAKVVKHLDIKVIETIMKCDNLFQPLSQRSRTFITQLKTGNSFFY